VPQAGARAAVEHQWTWRETMPTYILTWNPEKWCWPDDQYEKEVNVTRRGGLFSSRWSCGKTKRIGPGDRVFFFRQHTERGIIGSGYATSNGNLDDASEESVS
jgi:hypothetical protein